jgi:VIT1/CCC1 family predicted Fe2+/Mn2+ transporter
MTRGRLGKRPFSPPDDIKAEITVGSDFVPTAVSREGEYIELRCGDCGELVTPDITRCPHCHANLRTRRGQLASGLSVALSAVFYIVAFLNYMGSTRILFITLGLVLTTMGIYWWLTAPVYRLRPTKRLKRLE